MAAFAICTAVSVSVTLSPVSASTGDSGASGVGCSCMRISSFDDASRIQIEGSRSAFVFNLVSELWRVKLATLRVNWYREPGRNEHFSSTSDLGKPVSARLAGLLRCLDREHGDRCQIDAATGGPSEAAAASHRPRAAAWAGILREHHQS